MLKIFLPKKESDYSNDKVVDILVSFQDKGSVGEKIKIVFLGGDTVILTHCGNEGVLVE